MNSARHSESLLAWVQFTQPPCAQTNTVATTCCCPFVLDDAQVALLILASHAWRRGNGIQPWLDVRNVVKQMSQRGHSIWILRQDLSVRVAIFIVGFQQRLSIL